MTMRFSTGTRNGLAGTIGFQGLFNQGYCNIYTGSQPATADSAATGTLLGTLTSNSGALTKETRATGTVTITAAAGGSINTLTVGDLNVIPDGPVAAVAGDTAATAEALCNAINRNGMVEARVAASVVTIMGRPGSGAMVATIAGTLTTVTATYVAIGTAIAGVAPVNGLILATPVAGVVSKPSSSIQIWSFNGVATGVAGWFRFFSSDASDTGGALVGAPWYPRMDGSIASSGGDMGLSNLNITIGAPNTCDRFNGTYPAQ